ncbi:MAG: hypothetical protein D6744_06160, partial [Planctomycetota bacterium]
MDQGGVFMNRQSQRMKSVQAQPVGATIVAVMVVGLLVALASDAALVAESFAAVGLPGCGPDSPCARATASAWGRVPVLNWPTSFLGLAYYLGLLAAIVATRGRVSPGLKWFVRLGVVATIGFIGVALIERLICPYCLGAHTGFLCFAVAAEWAASKTRALSLGARRGATVALSTFLVATLALFPMRARAVAAAERAAERELAESTARLTSPQTEDVAVVAPPDEAADGGPVADGSASAPTTAAPPPVVVESEPASPWGPEGFTGRYRIGPAKAPIRIVILSDYQCPDCKKIERDVRALLEERDDISFSAKHFPMCTECNPHITRNMHPNACQAARAAEAAGILGGDAAFWQIHHWLFDVGGVFTARTLRAKLDELAFDYNEFLRVMQSDEVLGLIQADIDEGMALGLHFTPMIFINGVELRGWQAPNALRRAVTALARTNPPPLTAAADHPPLAKQKYIEDWRTQPTLRLRDAVEHTRGPEDARVAVVVFGDYQEENTRRVDAIFAELSRSTPMRYSFRHFPFDADCNPHVRTTRFEGSCRAA